MEKISNTLFGDLKTKTLGSFVAAQNRSYGKFAVSFCLFEIVNYLPHRLIRSKIIVFFCTENNLLKFCLFFSRVNF